MVTGNPGETSSRSDKIRKVMVRLQPCAIAALPKCNDSKVREAQTKLEGSREVYKSLQL